MQKREADRQKQEAANRDDLNKAKKAEFDDSDDGKAVTAFSTFVQNVCASTANPLETYGNELKELDRGQALRALSFAEHRENISPKDFGDGLKDQNYAGAKKVAKACSTSCGISRPPSMVEALRPITCLRSSTALTKCVRLLRHGKTSRNCGDVNGSEAP